MGDRHLKTSERFALTLFLLANGALPRAIAAYLAGSGLLSDASAHEHVLSVMDDFRLGKLKPGCKYYCMERELFVELHGPDSPWAGGAPVGMREGLIWDKARAILRRAISRRA